MAVLPCSARTWPQQLERLATDRVRLQVVGLLDELDPLPLAVCVDEHLNLDGADRLERDRLDVLIGHDNVAPLCPFIPAHRVGARDDLVIGGAVDLHLDAAQVGLVQQV